MGGSSIYLLLIFYEKSMIEVIDTVEFCFAHDGSIHGME